jgi:hypothetical protein
MKDAELWRLNRRDWASSRLITLSLALEVDDDLVVLFVVVEEDDDGFPR